MILSLAARVLSAVVSIYMLLCSIRIVLTWVPSAGTGRAGELLAAAVDPYLGFFSRFPALRTGTFDFSPIVGLSLLAVLNDILTTVAFAGVLSLGLVLGMVLGAAWSAVGFILSFFAVCALVRIIAYAARWNSLHPLWVVIDRLLNPVLYRINRVIYRDRIVNYLQGLVTGFAAIVLVRVAAGSLVGLVVRLLAHLPV